MISPKYSVAIIILATFALLPVTIHTYMGATTADGRSLGDIKEKLLSLYSIPTTRTTEKIEKEFATKEWIERNYITDSGRKILLFVARSFDYKKLYHHPEIALMGSLKISDRSLIKVSEFNDLPVHMILNEEGRQTGLIAYALLVNNTLIENPYVYQLTNSWKSLFQSARPMTLFFVFDPSYPGNNAPEKSTAVRLLNEAITSFQAL